MELGLDPLDLKEEHRKEGPQSPPGRKSDPILSAREVGYEHLNERAQKALQIAGRGVYQDWYGHYNAVYPPKKKEEQE